MKLVSLYTAVCVLQSNTAPLYASITNNTQWKASCFEVCRLATHPSVNTCFTWRDFNKCLSCVAV